MLKRVLHWAIQVPPDVVKAWPVVGAIHLCFDGFDRAALAQEIRSLDSLLP
jgi:hypothetical protein